MIKIGKNLKINNDPLCINFKSNRYVLIYLIKEPEYNYIEIEYICSDEEFDNKLYEKTNGTLETIGFDIENLTNKEIEIKTENIVKNIIEKYNEYYI